MDTATCTHPQTTPSHLVTGGERKRSEVKAAARAAGLSVRDGVAGVQLLRFAEQLNSDELRLLELPHDVLHALKSGERSVSSIVPSLYRCSTGLIPRQGEEKNYTVEPLRNGHIGTDHFVHYREVVLFWRQICIATIQQKLQRCPLFRVIKGSVLPDQVAEVVYL